MGTLLLLIPGDGLCPGTQLPGQQREQRGRRRFCCVMNCSEQEPAIFIGHDQIANSESSLMPGSGSRRPPSPAPHPELLLIQGTFDSERVGRPTSPTPQHTNPFSSLQQGEGRHFPPADCQSSLPIPARYYRAAGSRYKSHLCACSRPGRLGRGLRGSLGDVEPWKS